MWNFCFFALHSSVDDKDIWNVEKVLRFFGKVRAVSSKREYRIDQIVVRVCGTSNLNESKGWLFRSVIFLKAFAYIYHSHFLHLIFHLRFDRDLSPWHLTRSRPDTQPRHNEMLCEIGKIETREKRRKLQQEKKNFAFFNGVKDRIFNLHPLLLTIVDGYIYTGKIYPLTLLRFRKYELSHAALKFSQVCCLPKWNRQKYFPFDSFANIREAAKKERERGESENWKTFPFLLPTIRQYVWMVKRIPRNRIYAEQIHERGWKWEWMEIHPQKKA